MSIKSICTEPLENKNSFKNKYSQNLQLLIIIMITTFSLCNSNFILLGG